MINVFLNRVDRFLPILQFLLAQLQTDFHPVTQYFSDILIGYDALDNHFDDNSLFSYHNYGENAHLSLQCNVIHAYIS